MKNLLNTLSDHELVCQYQSNNGEIYLDCLLSRYESMLKKISHSHLLKFTDCVFDDVLQNARHGAILAFQRFNTQSSTSLSTFLHTTVYYHLLTCNDTQSFINCPSNLREIKSYCAGRYDFEKEKKDKFEKKHKLHNSDSIKTFKKDHEILANHSVYTEDILPERTFQSENEIIRDVYSKIFIESLPEDQKEIVILLMQGHSISKIAQIFTQNFGKKITDKTIKKKIETIKAFFV